MGGDNATKNLYVEAYSFRTRVYMQPVYFFLPETLG